MEQTWCASTLLQEVSKLVGGELRTFVTHYLFWEAVRREKVTQNADGLLCRRRLCHGEDLCRLEWASMSTKKSCPWYSP